MSASFDPYYTWLGIPPHEQPANHYRLLGISVFEPNAEVISNAADRAMLHLRAFQAGKRGKESQQLLNEVAFAQVTLLDPAKKASYDAELQARQAAHLPAPPVPLPISPPPAESPPARTETEPIDPAAAMPATMEMFRAPLVTTSPRGSPRAMARRRKPTPAIVIVALVAAALVALGGGIAFVVSRINGLHSGVAVRLTPVLVVSIIHMDYKC